MSDSVRLEKTRACINCSRAKAKCVWPNIDSDECQRCSRSSLTCSKTKSVSKKRRGKATHAKVIEQKLDEIMVILNGGRGREISTDRTTVLTPGSSSAFTPAASQVLNQNYEMPQSKQLLQPPTPTQHPGFITIVPGFQLSLPEADQALHEYAATMLPHFPFVPLSCYNAYDLYKEKPLLLKTILWVCRPPGQEASAAFHFWFRQHVAHQIVVLLTKSLELIQAILVFLAWNDIFFYAASKDTGLLQLAEGLIEDMRLNKSHKTGKSTFGSIVEDAAQLRNDSVPEPKQAADEHRAVLGVYYTKSILSSLLDKRFNFAYTSHLEYCCEHLIGNQTYATDLVLVNLVRLQQLAAKVNNMFWETIEVTNGGPPGNIHANAMAVASIQKELDTFINQLPSQLQWNYLLQTHCAAIRIRLFEPFRHGDQTNSLESRTIRSRLLLECLQSIQALFNAFCTIPTDSYPFLTFVPILHLALAIIKASRLLSVTDNAWDLSTARAMCDLPATLRQLSSFFETASNLDSPRCRIVLHGRPILSEYAEAYRNIERWYLSKMDLSASLPVGTIIGDGEQQDDLEFWNQLSDLTYGLVS